MENIIINISKCIVASIACTGIAILISVYPISGLIIMILLSIFVTVFFPIILRRITVKNIEFFDNLNQSGITKEEIMTWDNFYYQIAILRRKYRRNEMTWIESEKEAKRLCEKFLEKKIFKFHLGLSNKWPKCNYDKKADVMYISLGDPQGCKTIEMEDGILHRYTLNGELNGITIINYKKRVNNE